MPQVGNHKVIAECDGRVFRWVQAAERALAKEGISIDDRRVIVVDKGDTIVVLFVDLNSTDEVRGNIGPIPGFEVEIKKANLMIKRASFIR